ncbi:MAG: hypothetical protein VYB93_06510, partial [Pseudomonadota bacterium]|nr:hypothetical protein [Pseudomonadota bacterium]
MVNTHSAPALPRFETAFEALDPAFCTPCAPTPLDDLQLVHAQTALGHTLGLPADWLHSDDFRQILAGGGPPPPPRAPPPRHGRPQNVVV